MLPTEEMCFVIVTRLPQHVVTGTYYIGKDTVITKMNWQAARFRSYADATICHRELDLHQHKEHDRLRIPESAAVR
jgi:hypothetical protein